MNTFPPPQLPITPPPAVGPTSRSKPPAKAIGIFAAVAVVAAGGTFLVTRGDEPKTVAPVDTTTTIAVTAPPTTTAPVTVAPSTTVAQTAPPSTGRATAVIPEGATELGYGVYVPAIDGVEVSGDGPYTFTSSNEDRQIIAQVLNRDFGEDPNDLFQEYIDTWDSDYDNVVYSVSSVFEPGHLDHPNLRLARVYYSIHRPTPAMNLAGVIWSVVRDDGLTLLADQWGTAGEGVFDTNYDEVIESLANAPAVGEPHEFAAAVGRVPRNSRPIVDIPFTCNCEVVAAPGYVVTASTSTSVTLVNANSQMILQRVDGITSAEQAQQLAAQMVHGLAATATVNPFAPNERYLPFYFAQWNDSGGIRAFGGVWFLYDEDAGAMLIAISSATGTVTDTNALAFMVDGFAWQQWTLR